MSIMRGGDRSLAAAKSNTGEKLHDERNEMKKKIMILAVGAVLAPVSYTHLFEIEAMFAVAGEEPSSNVCRGKEKSRPATFAVARLTVVVPRWQG